MRSAPMTLSRHRLALLLLPVATVAVHQLRYVFAYGPAAGRVLVAQGDAYVESMLPGLVLLLVVAGGMLGWQLLAAARGGRPVTPARRRLGLRTLWAASCVGLLAAYLGQEALEVLLGSAHASVLSQAFGDGGLWAIPAAVLVGLGWALLARGARAALSLVAGRSRTRRRWRLERGCRRSRRPVCIPAPRRRPLSRRLAGRAPPLAVSVNGLRQRQRGFTNEHNHTTWAADGRRLELCRRRSRR